MLVLSQYHIFESYKTNIYRVIRPTQNAKKARTPGKLERRKANMTEKPESRNKPGKLVQPQGTITAPKHLQNKFSCVSRRCGLNSQRGDRNSSEFAVVGLSLNVNVAVAAAGAAWLSW
jgi:hypothetical protein